MSREADWREANIRARRICAESFVTYSPEQSLTQRWRVWERMTVPLTLDEDLLSQPGMTKETEAVVCAGATALEALHKYGLVKSAQRAQDAARERGETPKADYRVLFRDRVLRGEEAKPPPDPPEWEEYRKMEEARVKESGERMVEQVRGTVRNWMAIQGIDMTAEGRRFLGIGRGEHWTKGKR